MPLTNQHVVQVHEALVALIKNDKEEKYSIPVAARVVLAENLNLTIPVVEEFGKQHNALVAKYGEKQADGSYKVTDPEKNKAFQLERQAYLNEDSNPTVEAFGTFTVADLGSDQLTIDLIALLLKTEVLVK